MRTTLAIVGCGPRLEVALLCRDTAAPGIVALAGPTPRSDLVMAAVELLVRAAGLEPGDIEAVAATRGPGSFTGIRVALATARGLASGLGLPAFGVPSLTVQAARSRAQRCLAAQPARRGHVYVQEFRRDDPRALPVPHGDIRVVPVCELAGDRLAVVAPAGLELPPDVNRDPTGTTTAEALLELTTLVAAPDPDSLVPLYLEPPAAVPPRRTAKPWPPSPTAS